MQAYLSEKELLRTKYCSDFLLKYGIFQHCFSLFGNNGVALANLLLMRGMQDAPFAEEELRILRFLAPHVGRAIQFFEKFRDVKLESAMKQRALDRWALGVVFLDATGKILGSNEAAAAILEKQSGLSMAQGRLRALHPTDDKRLHAAIAESCFIGSGGQVGIPTGAGLLIEQRPPARPLQITVGPAMASAGGFGVSPSAVVFIHDPSGRFPSRTDLLQAMYGLSPAESRVALLLAEGHPGEQVAGQLGVSKNTLKTQTRSIFSKMNC